MQTHTYTDVADKSNFKKPGMHQHTAGLKTNLPELLHFKKDEKHLIRVLSKKHLSHNYIIILILLK